MDRQDSSGCWSDALMIFWMLSLTVSGVMNLVSIRELERRLEHIRQAQPLSADEQSSADSDQQPGEDERPQPILTRQRYGAGDKAAALPDEPDGGRREHDDAA
jgi:hypothetical protein